MRRLVAAALVAVIVAGAGPASAQTDPGVIGTSTGGVTVTDQDHGAPGGGSSNGSQGGGGSSGPTYYSYVAIGWGPPDMSMCIGVWYTTDPTVAAQYHNTIESLQAQEAALGQNIRVCPAAQPATPDPGTLARSFWDVRQLPSPSLKVVPDYGIVGKKVYLQIGGDNAKRLDVPDPLGPPITISATATYVIDWGDGTTGTTSSHGGPYPDGDVTHVYTQDASNITITVNEEWTASWSAGTAGGNLTGLRTTGSLPFRVEQVQAVGG